MMSVKRNIRVLIAAAILVLTGLFVLAGRSEVHAASFKEKEQYVWTDGSTSYYGKDNTLYKKAGGKETKLYAFQYESSGEEIFVKVANVYGGYIYMLKENDFGGSKLYSYNLKSGKVVLCSNACYVCKAIGAYMVTLPYKPTDVSAHPQTLYKANKGKIKKVRQLSSYGIAWTFVYNKRFIYASYASPDMSGKLAIKSCEANGKKVKTLFTVKGPKNAFSIPSAEGSKITVKQYVSSTTGNPTTKTYVYDLKTGKLKKE